MTHTSTGQTDALRLANWLDTGGWPSYVPQESAAELRRLQARVQELEAQAVRRTATPALPPKWVSLLEEARDNCMASIAEKDITPSRREYRQDLLSRLNDLLEEQKQAPTQGD